MMGAGGLMELRSM